MACRFTSIARSGFNLEGNLPWLNLAICDEHDRGVVSEVVLQIDLLEEASRILDNPADKIDTRTFGDEVTPSAQQPVLALNSGQTIKHIRDRLALRATCGTNHEET